MKINQYQLQIELFNAIKAGTSEVDLWDNLRVRKEELKHLLGGNPSSDEYKAQLKNACAAIRKEVQEADDMGVFSKRSLEFRFQEIDIAGQVLTDLMDLDPANVTDADDIRDSYLRLQGKADQASLRDCDTLLDGAYADAIDKLYGKPEVKDAEDVA